MKIILENGIIKELNSLYIFNIVVIRKKDRIKKNMNWIYINYTSFNKITILNRYLLSNINEILLSFLKAKWFIIINLVLAY